ncbi:MAG TPA: orotidine 5'-phosphate decarboxylase / HUMPS family protein, partial [Nitrososphaera sp.]|nr:orotidine 5'-phosphate decarboxylase / HUMPS family protein [Nitrososphaera sp.]
MTKSQYRNRISAASVEKKSRIVLALDPAPSRVTDALVFARRMIQTLQDQVCAIKVNFHMILPLSGKELAEISRLAHSSGLQCIADIKLNDIDNTNEAVVEHLIGRMGFDAVIANPFIGGAAMKNLVGKANDLGGGVIALVYMSHPGAVEGFGLK